MILITQTCDGCGKERRLATVANKDDAGWREWQKDKHLCARCIENAFNQTSGASDD